MPSISPVRGRLRRGVCISHFVETMRIGVQLLKLREVCSEGG